MSNRVKPTWKVIEWSGESDGDKEGELLLDCPHCGREAAMPTRGISPPIIAAMDLGIVYDYLPVAPGFMPKTVQCRKCRHQFTKDQG